MGIVNATPDSTSPDRQGEKSLDELVARGGELVADGAVVDVGGESGARIAPPCPWRRRSPAWCR